MSRIALKSKRLLFFPPAYKDVEVEMDIELIQNNPLTESYTLKIVDRAYKEFEETLTLNKIKEGQKLEIGK